MKNKPLIRVDFGSPFLAAIKRYSKKYHRLGDDIKPLVDQLKRGETPGDQVRGVGYTAYKVRVRSSDLQRGKSGGFRVIYYIRTADRVVLVTLYPKSERGDISPEEIRRLIEDHMPPTE